MHRIRYKPLLLTVILFSIITLGIYDYIEEQGNFHAITPNEAYRSGQLDTDELEHYIKKYNIKSILNLRGPHPKTIWYAQDIQASEKFHINHYDVSLSASHAPTEQDIEKIIKIFREAPRPIMIHCQAGADRSGLVSAMWKIVVDGTSQSEAKKQLSIIYGHFPIGSTVAMDQFFEDWSQKSVQNSENFHTTTQSKTIR
jgi:protein tyrosine/serine phosphatase